MHSKSRLLRSQKKPKNHHLINIIADDRDDDLWRADFSAVGNHGSSSPSLVAINASKPTLYTLNVV